MAEDNVGDVLLEKYNVRYQIPTLKYDGGNIIVLSVFSAQRIGPLLEIELRKEIMHSIIQRDI